METTIRFYEDSDIPKMRQIWNEVVRQALAFPQEFELSSEEAKTFFDSQTACGIACAENDILGLYILHPNNIGRCNHICNASYAVAKRARGRGIGAQLVEHSLIAAKNAGFRIMQFNAVVADNHAAHALYKKLGFKSLGVVPGGFRRKDGSFVDIQLYYYELQQQK